jgi:hypothetical protein
MTSIELHKYINDNSIEWHWTDNDGPEDVLIFPFVFQLEEFSKMVIDYAIDCRLECTLAGKYCDVRMKDVCAYYGIDINEIFPKQEDNQ